MTQDINLDQYSAPELIELQSKIDQAIKDSEVRTREELMASFTAQAAEKGMTLKQVFGTVPASKKNRDMSPPKYRNPKNESETWTGRGRQPKWFKEAISSGQFKAEELEV